MFIAKTVTKEKKELFAGASPKSVVINPYCPVLYCQGSAQSADFFTFDSDTLSILRYRAREKYFFTALLKRSTLFD